MTFVKFPSIQQYHSLIVDVKKDSTFQGLDMQGNPIYNADVPLPTLTFSGSVKLHGSNAGVCFSKQHGIYAQSRNRVLSVDNDNAGFCTFVQPLLAYFQTLFQLLMERIEFDFEGGETLVVFGEWCGGNIQKGVGICKVPKMFVVFSAAVMPAAAKVKSTLNPRWLPDADWRNFSAPEQRIFNIQDYATFKIDIDFSRPEASQAQLQEITEQVERECPVALAFGIAQGTGEGVVWTAFDRENVWRFKVKGDEHKVTKTKQCVPISTEHPSSLEEFIDNVVTENRLMQGIAEVFTSQNNSVSQKETMTFLRWVQDDVLKEERDTITTSGFSEVAVMKAIREKARPWFTKHCAMVAGRN